ncbi:MAG: LamG-like jellyroll fold domain-containing protein [Planctomycetota bacterium]
MIRGGLLAVVGAAWAATPPAIAQEAAPPDPGPRRPNRVLVLDGSSAVRVHMPEAFESARALTVEWWMRARQQKGNARLVSTYDGGGWAFDWALPATDVPRINVRHANGHWVESWVIWAQPEWKWTHVAVTLDDRHQAVWVDGELSVRHRWEHFPLRWRKRPFCLGAEIHRGGYRYHYKGMVDELRVSDSVRYHKPFRPAKVHRRDRRTLLLMHFDTPAGEPLLDDSGHDRRVSTSGKPGTLQEEVDTKAPAPELPLGHTDAALLRRVNPAVERAVRWLLEAQQDDGSWRFNDKGDWPTGITALCIHALIHGGVNPHDPRIERAFKYLRQRWTDIEGHGHARAKEWPTYTVGCTLLALESKALWVPAGVIEKPAKPAERLSEEERDWVRSLRDQLLSIPGHVDPVQESLASWAYPLGTPDISNTQFGVLGLRAATRLGHPAPIRVWRAILAKILDWQRPDGTPVRRVVLSRTAERKGVFKTLVRKTSIDRARPWSYRFREGRDKGSTTLIGLACLVLSGAEVNRAAEKGDKASRAFIAQHGDRYGRAVHDGLAYMNRRFSVVGNPGERTWHHYYLYAMERAGVLLDVPNLGVHDWYRQGAEQLLDSQQSKGLWDSHGEGPIESTCYAVLFLTRATRPALTAISLAGTRK